MISHLLINIETGGSFDPRGTGSPAGGSLGWGVCTSSTTPSPTLIPTVPTYVAYAHYNVGDGVVLLY